MYNSPSCALGLWAGVASSGTKFCLWECSMNRNQNHWFLFGSHFENQLRTAKMGRSSYSFLYRLSLQTSQAHKKVSRHWKITRIDQENDELCFPLQGSVLHRCRHSMMQGRCSRTVWFRAEDTYFLTEYLEIKIALYYLDSLHLEQLDSLRVYYCLALFELIVFRSFIESNTPMMV